MKTEPEVTGSALLWSHNENKHPFWLGSIMRLNHDIWWDVRWKLKVSQFRFPIPGYIWNTVEQQITHRTNILEVDSSPSDEKINRVLSSWKEDNLHVNLNSPLLLYQKDHGVTCTLLKLSDLVRLRNPGQIEDTILFKEKRPIGQGPQGVAIIEDPRLS